MKKDTMSISPKLKLKRYTERKLNKLRNTLEYGVSKVKEVADSRFWCTSHKNCFRASVKGENKGESELHIRKKFERWLHHRKLGRMVFTELILKSGGRPDLVVVEKGFIFIEEIYHTESNSSKANKQIKYPFSINWIKA